MQYLMLLSLLNQMAVTATQATLIPPKISFLNISSQFYSFIFFQIVFDIGFFFADVHMPSLTGENKRNVILTILLAYKPNQIQLMEMVSAYSHK